jgi:hypothetical protein
MKKDGGGPDDNREPQSSQRLSSWDFWEILSTADARLDR